jgi:hypothetical protein
MYATELQGAVACQIAQILDPRDQILKLCG